MMSNEEVRGRASWRKAIVPIAATAATVIGGMVLATPANAATPTVTVTAPAQLASDGVATGPLSIKVDNTGGTADPQADLAVSMTLPGTEITCGDVTLAATGTSPTLNLVSAAGDTGTCQWRVYNGVGPVYFDFAAGPQTLTYDMTIDGAKAAAGVTPAHYVTGAVSTTAQVLKIDAATGANLGSYAGPSAAASTTLVAPASTISLAQKAAGSITNNNIDGVTYTLTITNPANTGQSGAATPKLTFTVPTGVTTVTVDGNPTAACTVASGVTTCVYTAPNQVLAEGTNKTVDYLVRVNNPGITGTISVSATLTGPDNGGGAPVTTSNSVTTALVGPTAPAFAAAPPAATIYQAYSYQVVSSPGTGGTTDYYAACVTTDNSVTPATHTLNYIVPNTGVSNGTVRPVAATAAGNDTLQLGNFTFSAKTGKITATPTDVRATDATPDCQWYLIANNGVPGATAAVTKPADDSAPEVAVDDVQTSFALPILFKDTAVSSTFGAQIYALSEMPFNGANAPALTQWDNGGVIGGYADGTFRGSQPVSRQAFAHFLAGLLNNELGTVADPTPFPTGNCTTVDPSAFNDVPNSSTFCQDIKSLAEAGIINGYKDGGFHPNALISRQAMSAFVYRTDAVQRGVPTSTIADAACLGTTRKFNDVNTSNQFCGDIEWMATNGITTGYPDGGFHPIGNASREATAAFLGRLWSMWNPA